MDDKLCFLSDTTGTSTGDFFGPTAGEDDCALVKLSVQSCCRHLSFYENADRRGWSCACPKQNFTHTQGTHKWRHYNIFIFRCDLRSCVFLRKYCDVGLPACTCRPEVRTTRIFMVRCDQPGMGGLYEKGIASFAEVKR